MTRIVIVYRNLGPYHYARIRALSRLSSGVDIVELTSSSEEYMWEASDGVSWRQTTLFPRRSASDLPPQTIMGRVCQTLDSTKPDVVVTAGYRTPEALACARWAHRHKRHAILMLASWKGSKRRWWIKERLKAWFVPRTYSAAFVGGWRHHDYARALGFPDSRIWRGVDVVDNQYFADRATEARASDSAFLGSEIAPDQFFLCVARLSPEKNLHRLLDAFQRYRAWGGTWDLVLAGDGPQRTELLQRVEQQHIGGCRFPGWVSYAELPCYYGVAGALVLPSLFEPWGLVVNEAMASGLPVLVSRQCGCLPELCWRGVNGQDFDPLDVQDLAKALMGMSQLTASERHRMGLASQHIISALTPESWAVALLDCVRSVSS